MKDKRNYFGIRTLELHNSAVYLSSKFSPFRGENFLPRIIITDVSLKPGGGGSTKISSDYKNKTISLTDVKASVYVPYGRRTNIYGRDNSYVNGRCLLGHLDFDDTSRIELDNLSGFPRMLGPLGSTVEGLAGDLSAIVATALPVGAGVASFVRFFGGTPVDYSGCLDETALLASGLNVGFRGDNLRTFLTCLGVAGAAIFGPEIKDAVVTAFSSGSITQGVYEALDNLGIKEDLRKALGFLLMWGGAS